MSAPNILTGADILPGVPHSNGTAFGNLEWFLGVQRAVGNTTGVVTNIQSDPYKIGGGGGSKPHIC